MAAPQSAPVEAVIRAVNVEALSPCSAVQIQYVSIAFTWSGFASPRQRRRNFSAAVSPWATTSSGAGSRPSWTAADLRDDRHHLRGEPREIVAGLLGVDVDELLQLPDRREAGRLGLEVGGSVPGERRRLVRLGVRHPRLEVLVDEQAPDLLVGTLPTSSSISTPR